MFVISCSCSCPCPSLNSRIFQECLGSVSLRNIYIVYILLLFILNRTASSFLKKWILNFNVFGKSCELNQDAGNDSLMFEVVNHWLEGSEFKSHFWALKQCPGFVDSSKNAVQQQTLQSDSHFLLVGWCQNTISPLGYLKYIFCSLDLKYNHRTCSASLVTLHFPTLVMDFPFPCRSYSPFSATSYPSTQAITRPFMNRHGCQSRNPQKRIEHVVTRIRGSTLVLYHRNTTKCHAKFRYKHFLDLCWFILQKLIIEAESSPRTKLSKWLRVKCLTRWTTVTFWQSRDAYRDLGKGCLIVKVLNHGLKGWEFKSQCWHSASVGPLSNVLNCQFLQQLKWHSDPSFRPVGLCQNTTSLKGKEQALPLI